MNRSDRSKFSRSSKADLVCFRVRELLVPDPQACTSRKAPEQTLVIFEVDGGGELVNSLSIGPAIPSDGFVLPGVFIFGEHRQG